VREESHLDDMRAAIRGDFERLEERRGEQDLMRIAEEDPDAHEQSEPDPVPEPASAVPAQDLLEDALSAEPEPRGEAARRKPWLDRLLGR